MKIMNKNKLQLALAKRIINDKSYRTNRMRLMFDNLVFWDNKEKQASNFSIEKEYCKKMQEIYFKRLQWYKNKE